MTLTPSVHPSARTMPKGTAQRSPSPAKAVALNQHGIDAVYWFMPQLIDYARFVLALPLVLLLPPAGAPEAADMRPAPAVGYVCPVYTSDTGDEIPYVDTGGHHNHNTNTLHFILMSSPTLTVFHENTTP